ncbi:transcription elongation regulator 1 isoform X2 [Drosophila tropicalis]|uniref:transcription elongation regulator 1 isoform X2 n=1 Tax=Drosophila tropicalis TaxID=46794 RepID=UPI0035ABD4CB
MLSPCLLLVTCLVLHTQAIRVDWGTNTGPIVPPPPRTTPQPPRKPYREPAPVWEDQSDDIPNPNPYVYVLPPPSRPRTWAIPAGPYAPPNYNNQPPQANYGQLVTPTPQFFNGGAGAGGGVVGGTTVVPVPALAAQYVPGVGIKYTAIVMPNKLQGKYNAKTKKYKAYEKAKYAPWNYLLPMEEKAMEWQAQLEAEAEAQMKPVSSSTTTTTTTTTPVTITTTGALNIIPTTITSDPSSTSTTSTTTTAAAAAIATREQHQPTTIANYKLAHEKSTYLKKHNKLKKLLQLEKERAENENLLQQQANQTS